MSLLHEVHTGFDYVEFVYEGEVIAVFDGPANTYNYDGLLSHGKTLEDVRGELEDEGYELSEPNE